MDFKDIPSADFSKILGSMPPVTPQFNFSVPKIPEIDPTSTVQYKIQEQTRLLTEQSQKQIEALTGQNKQLEALIEQRDKELKQSNRQNATMLWITVIACLAAIVSAVFTVLMATGVIG